MVLLIVLDGASAHQPVGQHQEFLLRLALLSQIPNSYSEQNASSQESAG